MLSVRNLKNAALSLVAAAAMLTGAPALAAGGAPWAPLMTVDEAAEALKTPGARIIDIRHPELGFARGRIDGSASIPFRLFRGRAGGAGAPPKMSDLSALIGDAGLTQDQPILIVHSGLDERSFAAASWVYWVLKSTGFERLSILDGGVRGWRSAGLPVTTEPQSFSPTTVELTFSDRWLATTDEVEDIANGDASGDLLDSRADAVEGERSILGSVGHAFTQMMSPNRRTGLTPVEMLERLKYAEVDWQAETVITFCNDGLQGAATWFMASEVVGITDVKLYAASLAGWDARDAADVASAVTD